MSTAITEFEPHEGQSEDSSNEPSNNQIILDSLPYIDNIHPDYEAYALSLIEEEMQAMVKDDDEPPTEESLLQHLHLPNPLGESGEAKSTPDTFKSSSTHTGYKNQLNRNEYEDLVARNGQPRQNKVDYKQLIQSGNAAPIHQSKQSGLQENNDTEEWNEAIKKAKIELEYERLRMVNIELQAEYESSLWKYQTKNLESISARVKSNLSKMQMKVDQINAKRQDLQVSKAAPELHVLSQKWDEGINKVRVLSRGVEKIQREVKELRKETSVDFSTEKREEDSDDDDL